MGKTYDHITAELREFIAQQNVYFVATAPLDPRGHVNLSPKGLDSFRVLGEKRVAYLDLTGSGNETSAHLEENGRITLMFCAFAGAPKILRLYGRGRTIIPGGGGWDALAADFRMMPGARQIIVVDIERVQTSCGFGVPMYDFQGHREMLTDWAAKKGADGIAKYHREKNAASIDGIATTLGRAFRGTGTSSV